MVELVPFVIGGEALVVEGKWRFSANDTAIAFEELQSHGTCHSLLNVRHKCINGLARGCEPQSVVDDVGILLGEALLEALEILRNHHPFELAMRVVQHHAGRRFVDLPRFDADQTVFHHVDAAHTMHTGDGFKAADQLGQRHDNAVDGRRHAFLPLDFHIGRCIGRIGGRFGQRVNLIRRLIPRVFQNAALDRASPQVFIGAVGTRLCRRHRHAAQARVLNLFRARHAPHAGRRNHLNRRIDGARRDVDAHLVVALPGAAVRDGGGILHLRDFHELLCDERAAQRGRQRIALLVHGAGLQRRQNIVAREFLAHVEHVAADGAGRHRARANLRELAPLAQIQRDGDHFCVVFLFQPRDRHRGVEPARICQNDAHELPSFISVSRGPTPATCHLELAIFQARSRRKFVTIFCLVLRCHQA